MTYTSQRPDSSELNETHRPITQENVDTAPTFPEALRLFLEWSQPLERLVLATWSHYDLWQLDLDLEAHGLPKLGLSFLDVKKLAARIVGSKSFEETARELVPNSLAMPRHRAIADALGLPESLPPVPFLCLTGGA